MPTRTSSGRGSAWLWVPASSALGVLALAGFLVFRLLSGDVARTVAVAVGRPGRRSELRRDDVRRRQAADQALGSMSSRFASRRRLRPISRSTRSSPRIRRPGRPSRRVIDRADASRGSETGRPCPDLLGKTESEALNAHLRGRPPDRDPTEEFDPLSRPARSSTRIPSAGLVVTRGLLVELRRSRRAPSRRRPRRRTPRRPDTDSDPDPGTDPDPDPRPDAGAQPDPVADRASG